MKLILLLGRHRGGGTEAHANWLFRSLRDVGIDAELYCLFPKHGLSSLAEGFYEVLALSSAQNHFLRLAKSKKPDLIICFGRLANCCGHEIKRQMPEVCLVATCRTNRRLPADYRKTLSVANLVLTNSDWARHRVTNIRGVSAARVKTVPNALLRPDLASAERSTLRTEAQKMAFGLDPSRPVLGMLAHFVKGKNQECLIRMLAEERLPPGTQLILAGAGPRLNYCRRMVRRLGLGAEVCLPGDVEDPSDVFSASDLIVSTSLRDSMPNALIEAQAFGSPVVAFDVAGVAESFLHGEGGRLVQLGNDQEFVEAIKTLMLNNGSLQQYCIKASKYALSSFQPEKALSEYLGHFRSLLARHESVIKKTHSDVPVIGRIKASNLIP